MPEVGDAAPDFELKSHLDRERTVRLADFQGKKNVVLAFHPLAFTPVCSAQMPAYEADLERFKEFDAEVLSLSVDSQAAKAAWAKSMGDISFDLLADFEPKGAVAKLYGVYREKEGFSERALFIVDKQGKIAYKAVLNIPEMPSNETLFEELRKLS